MVLLLNGLENQLMKIDVNMIVCDLRLSVWVTLIMPLRWHNIAVVSYAVAIFITLLYTAWLLIELLWIHKMSSL